MQELVEKKHEVILQLKKEAKARKEKTGRKPLWNYKLYVVDNYLVIDCLWPCVLGDYLPEPETHGLDLYKGLARMLELAAPYGLKVRMYSRYGRKANCLFQYISTKPRTSLLFRIHRIGTQFEMPPKVQPIDDSGKDAIEAGVYVYEVQALKETQSVKEKEQIDTLLPEQGIPE